MLDNFRGNKMTKEMMQYRAMMNEVESLRNFAYSEFCSDSIRKIYLRVANELVVQAMDIKSKGYTIKH